MGPITVESLYPKLETGRIALLDADYVKYIVSSKIYKDLQEKQLKGELDVFIKEEPAIHYTKEWLQDIFSKISDPIIFCFSGKSFNTFRHNIAFEREYKSNRKKDYTEYPNKLQDMMMAASYIIENYTSLIYEDLEADDIVSFLQDPDNTYIISKDKDLKQVPGWHYNFSTNNISEITNEMAIYNLCYQLIVGDTTDAIVGLKGKGEKFAIDFLSKLSPKQYINETLKLYQKEFGLFKGTDYFTEVWMLVKMRENRGEHFSKKYKGAFDTKEMLMLELQKRKLQ